MDWYLLLAALLLLPIVRLLALVGCGLDRWGTAVPSPDRRFILAWHIPELEEQSIAGLSVTYKTSGKVIAKESTPGLGLKEKDTLVTDVSGVAAGEIDVVCVCTLTRSPGFPQPGEPAKTPDFALPPKSGPSKDALIMFHLTYTPSGEKEYLEKNFDLSGPLGPQ